MKCAVLATIGALLLIRTASAAAQPGAATEYSKHFAALSHLSVAVAQAMPSDEYTFRPHPESMTFGELMSHIAATNYQFCAGLKDTDAPTVSSATGKADVVKLLSESFEYCSAIVSNLTENQLKALHNSPDGRLSGREVLLAMYIHIAHHRGQAEIYLRDKGIKPPSYIV